ncbi:ABC transporter family substrate-binding protein [Brevibacterium sp. 50QC2O2]|uniref:ABC transporter family substrate-binding protein n=1 Tax=Brevibacterium TaxID=1696 RepID=UPI00211CCE8E|nr:ABC transporter family substrate-binding protein [Brevibacterium sp. 91QC2O2]MCQ9384733.1 ABC transporter family substrate-binding protein [Brevibacterium sp. 68QC2CO]MCQ9387496.1 ABC transporter family substrate-binding protein [Brevibacterium sp. 50QC2O2]
MKKRFLSLGAAAAATALLLSACTPNNGGGDASADGGGNGDAELKVMWNQSFYSSNINSSTANAVANSNIKYFTDDAFSYYDHDLKVQPNTSFGKVEKVSDSPMKVKFTIADTAKWSDGTPYSAADLVLAWGAQSTNFNTKDAAKVADDSGNVKKQSGENVVFNSADPGIALIKKFPEISDDGKSVTFEYSKPFADWEITLSQQDSGLPAHIVAKKALGLDDATKANDAVLKAFKDDDKASLTKLANVWNTGFDFTKLPSDPDLLVGTGPFKMTEFQEGQFLTLERRDDYAGERKPDFKKITFRFNEDPTAAVQALQNGEVDMINPQATADILKSVKAIDGVNVLNADGATYEHVDLVFANGGPFDPKTYGGDKEKAKKVRKAFLQTIPREKIVNDIIKPLKEDAQVRDSFIQVPGSPTYDQMVKDGGWDAAYGKVDVDGAKKLLSEAGVSKPKVRLIYAKGNARREQEFQLIKESAEQAGFQVVDGADAQWSEHLPDTSRYDASLFGWQSENTGVSAADANFRSTGQNNYGKYNNPEVDKLFDQLQGELDPAKQADISGKIEKHLVDDGFGTTIFQFPEVIGVKNTIEGVNSTSVAPTLFWNYFDWKVQ